MRLLIYLKTIIYLNNYLNKRYSFIFLRNSIQNLDKEPFYTQSFFYYFIQTSNTIVIKQFCNSS